jgi:hypothetical protein
VSDSGEPAGGGLPRVSRAFRLYWIARTVSIAGSQLARVALTAPDVEHRAVPGRGQVERGLFEFPPVRGRCDIARRTLHGEKTVVTFDYFRHIDVFLVGSPRFPAGQQHLAERVANPGSGHGLHRIPPLRPPAYTPEVRSGPCGNTAMKGASIMHKRTRHERTRGFTLIELLDSDPAEEAGKDPEE